MILIDTQAFIWSASGDTRLGEVARQRLDTARAQGQLYMSSISAWEIAMLADKGRLPITRPTGDWISAAARGHNLRWADVTADIAVGAGDLPVGIHGDPADRLIIATARALNCPLMTADRKILDYAAKGHVQAIDAGR